MGFSELWSRIKLFRLDMFACLDQELHLEPQSTAVLIPTGLALHIADPEWCRGDRA